MTTAAKFTKLCRKCGKRSKVGARTTQCKKRVRRMGKLRTCRGQLDTVIELAAKPRAARQPAPSRRKLLETRLAIARGQYELQVDRMCAMGRVVEATKRRIIRLAISLDKLNAVKTSEPVDRAIDLE